MSFKKNKYAVVKQAISKDLATFLANYFSMQKQVYDTCRAERYLSPYEHIIGNYESKDEQIPDTYCQYANIAMETLLLKCQTLMEKTTGLKLTPSYTYARIYKKGDVLNRHKDRFSCEISTTMNLGGDDWPLCLNPDPKGGYLHGKLYGQYGIQDYKETRDQGIKVHLKPGDILIYRGCDLEHWREKFKGKECIQVFLHYSDRKRLGSKHSLFDGRVHLGLPHCFQKKR